MTRCGREILRRRARKIKRRINKTKDAELDEETIESGADSNIVSKPFTRGLTAPDVDS